MAGLPVTGSFESVGAEGGDTSCTTPDISEDNLRIPRPPAPPLPEEVELPTPAAAKGMMPTGAVPVAVNPVEAAADGETLMGDGMGLTNEEFDGEGSTDASGKSCGFRISR
jgi:hypothetical protein